jgi:hypothetical protein
MYQIYQKGGENMMKTIKERQRETETGEYEQLPALMDEQTTARVAGVSVAFLRRGRYEGRIGARTLTPPFIKLGDKRVKYRLSDVQAWLEGLKSQATI